MDSTTCTSETSSDEIIHPNRNFQCNYKNCKARFSKNSKLVIHIRTHTGERPFACDEPNCKRTYTNSTHLKRHKRISHSAKNVRVKCTADGCNLWLSNPFNLKRHIHRMHNTDRKYPFVCKECKEGFFKKRLLQKHMYLHTGEFPFKCDICNKKFMTSNECNTHKKTHTCYECNCGNVFERWSNLLQHRKICIKKSFKCEECHKTFKNNRLLTYHMKTHLDLKDREIFVCDYDGCNRKYFYKRNLVHHINSFHKHIRNMIPCPHDGCDVILSRKQSLDLHLKLHKVQKRMNKSKKLRKDKGVRKKCSIAQIVGVDLPKDVHEMIISGERVNLEHVINAVGTESSRDNILTLNIIDETSEKSIDLISNDGMPKKIYSVLLEKSIEGNMVNEEQNFHQDKMNEDNLNVNSVCVNLQEVENVK